MKRFFNQYSDKLFTGLMFSGVAAGATLSELDRKKWLRNNPDWTMVWKFKGMYAGVPLGEWEKRRKDEAPKEQEEQDKPGPSC